MEQVEAAFDTLQASHREGRVDAERRAELLDRLEDAIVAHAGASGRAPDRRPREG